MEYVYQLIKEQTPKELRASMMPSSITDFESVKVATVDATKDALDRRNYHFVATAESYSAVSHRITHDLANGFKVVRVDMIDNKIYVEMVSRDIADKQRGDKILCSACDSPCVKDAVKTECSKCRVTVFY